MFEKIFNFQLLDSAAILGGDERRHETVQEVKMVPSSTCFRAGLAKFNVFDEG